MVEVWLPYGKTEVFVGIPSKSLQNIIEPKEMVKMENPQVDVENALMSPVGTERLAEIAKPGDKVSIVLKNCGTSTNQIMVSALLKELNSAEIKDEAVTVIVAYDPLHDSSPEEKTVLLGDELSSRVSIIQHDWRGSEHKQIGKTSLGTEVHLNKVFAEADVKVLAGVVEPYPLMGYSGGREGVLGVSSNETIQHSLSLSLNRKVERGVLDDNLVHEDMVEAAQLVNVDFSLNVVRNNRLEVVKVFSGGISEVFLEGVKFVDEMYKIPIESRADIVFFSPGGASFDKDLFEACIGIDGALQVTKRGKVMVLVAECPLGYGNIEFRDILASFKDLKSLEKSLKKNFSAGRLMAYRLLMALQNTKIFLVSVLPDYYISKDIGIKTARTVNEAYRYASDEVGKNGKVSFIPYGNLTIPLVKSSD